jgi:ubiquinone/menaquinone biosynthesis C-methylase UbiE
MTAPDPYRSIARFFPALDFMLDILLREARSDLISFLRAEGLAKVLDLGCGTGGLSRVLADRGFSPVCLDVSEAMLERAERNSRRPPRYPVVRSAGERLPFGPEFDASLMRFVLHEMSPAARESTLAELKRVIRPGGFMIFIDFVRPPDMGNLYSRFGSFVISFLESRMTRIHAPHYENFAGIMREGGALKWLETRTGPPHLFRSYFGGNIGLICIGNTPK